jgi:Flp pilus assembly pilin Flp
MKNLMNRAKHVLKGEDGASNIEIIVWISVVLVIATALFLFRDAITGFLGKAKGSVDGLQVK